MSDQNKKTIRIVREENSTHSSAIFPLSKRLMTTALHFEGDKVVTLLSG